jgi:MYXO-CTERM domain-containing protein
MSQCPERPVFELSDFDLVVDPAVTCLTATLSQEGAGCEDVALQLENSCPSEVTILSIAPQPIGCQVGTSGPGGACDRVLAGETRTFRFQASEGTNAIEASLAVEGQSVAVRGTYEAHEVEGPPDACAVSRPGTAGGGAVWLAALLALALVRSRRASRITRLGLFPSGSSVW